MSSVRTAGSRLVLGGSRLVLGGSRHVAELSLFLAVDSRRICGEFVVGFRFGWLGTQFLKFWRAWGRQNGARIARRVATESPRGHQKRIKKSSQFYDAFLDALEGANLGICFANLVPYWGSFWNQHQLKSDPTLRWIFERIF